MNIYTFIEKNGNAIINISADTSDQAFDRLNEIAKYPKSYSLEYIEDEEGDMIDE